MNQYAYTVFDSTGVRTIGEVNASDCNAALKKARQSFFAPMVRAVNWVRPPPTLHENDRQSRQDW